MSPQNVSTEILQTLHRILRQLTDLGKRLERGPQQIRNSDGYTKHCEGLLAVAEEDVTKAKMAADAKHVQLKSGEGKVEELKVKLNTASSNKEYQSLKDQIAALEMANSVLDDEILESWEKIEELKEKVDEAKKVVEAAQKKAQAVHQEVEEQEPLIRGDIERLQGELKATEDGLPVDFREIYNRVIRQKGEDGLASVDNQICTGCYQQVPLNVCNQILLEVPSFCQTCGRLLYMPENWDGNGGL